jgi:hypothetical protein
MKNIAKPKLIYFQKIRKDLVEFAQMQKRQHVKCLSEFFDTVVIHEDCDYQEICDKYQPDLALFESGFAVSDRWLIKNTSAHPEIPKLGFYNGDPWDGARSAFLSNMEHWGIQTFFTMSVPLAEYMPQEIVENLFTWANFIDPELYHDYGESKIIPVLFTGSHSSLYPWRQRIQKIVSQSYPSLICPHLGYEKRATSRMMYGEQYARTINAAWFVPSCGTVAKEVVRKHFEIPAAKSCLIAEKTPALEAAGFVDLQNCVFADEADVLDKIDYLFQNPEELERITHAGYQLVHSQHTYKQRDQILQWFRLNQILKPGEKIVQKSPFGPLAIVEASTGIKNSHIIYSGLDRVLLRQGDEKLQAGEYDTAETLYLKCLSYSPILPEPKLRLAICNLYKGKALAALDWIVQPLQWTLVNSKALDPDPVEWAYFIIALLCQGRLSDASKRARQFPSLRHLELERTRWLIHLLENPQQAIPLPNSDLSHCRLSVQQLPHLSLIDWIERVCLMLKACHQFSFAETLSGAISSTERDLTKPTNPVTRLASSLVKAVKNNRQNRSKKLSNIVEELLNSHPKLQIKFYNLSITARPFYLTLLARIASKLQAKIIQFLNRLETRFVLPLPYPFSVSRYDEFFSTVHQLSQAENIKTSLAIGAAAGEKITEAFLAGVRQNQQRPTAFCLNLSTPRFLKLQRYSLHDSAVRCYNISSPALDKLPEKNETNNTIKRIKQENQIDCFDLVLIDGSEFQDAAELDEVYGAKFVLLDDINTRQNYQNLHRLLADPDYTLVAQNSSLRNGYAIFQKVNNKVADRSSTVTEIPL